MAGHLFITRGDLGHLACDAILVPSGVGPDGRRGHVQEHWRAFVGADHAGYAAVPAGDEWVVHRVGRRTRWPDPTVWIGHTGDDAHTPTEDAEVLVRFVREASATTNRVRARKAPESERPLGVRRPLVAVPIVGTGLAGRKDRKGQVIVAIVRALLDLVQDPALDADVVLVAWDAAHYSAAQQARARYAPPHADLRRDLVEPLEQLVTEADRGRLVLFLGAGVSMGAGLPSWQALLDALVEETGMAPRLDADARRGLDTRDVATLVKLALGEDRPLGAAVCEVMRGFMPRAADGSPRVSLVHQLLAALPVTEAATTNYDDLFEAAWVDAGRSPDVLPKTGPATAPEWLLKLHGTLDEPDSIVLARDDYLRFEGQGSALAGLVHAMLLTRYLLFVGYSLSDDNFHRIVHQVRATASIPSTDGAQVGTVLTAAPAGVLAPIWRPELEFVSTTEDAELDLHQQAVFLDQLASATSPAGAHLLDPTWAAVFTPTERKVRDAVVELKALARKGGVRPSLRRELGDALRRFGGDA